MGLVLITPATVFPVSLQEAKDHCHVTQNNEDNWFNLHISAATKHLEGELGISIAEQQWQLTLDQFADTIELPNGPVSAVDTFEYVDEDGLTQPVDADLYTVDLTSRKQWIVRNSDSSWPALMSGINTVSVTYTAGFETAPTDLRAAILLLVGHWHEHRSTVVVGETANQVPFAVESLTQKFRTILV